jgi:hypothetical protein
MKTPVPVASDVLEPAIVGSAVVAQHTPLAVTDAPPSEVTFPPETAVVNVIEVIAVVVTVGAVTGLVVNETSLPYEVPMLFVA